MIETTYSSEPQLARPRLFFSRMAADLVVAHQLGWRLAIRNLRSKYRRSLLGYIWAVLPVLTTTLIWVGLNASGLLSIRDTGISYPAFVLVNITLWQGFVDALLSPLQQMESARSMLTKVNFARESLIIAGLVEVLFTFVIRLVLLLGALVWFGVPLAVTSALAPLAILALVLLGTTLGLLLLPLGLLYEDVQRGLIIACSLWIFATPVFYPPPTHWPYTLITYVNPVTPLLVTAREWLTLGVLSQPVAFVLVTGASLIVGAAAWVLYRLAMPHLIARISS
ncbi:MAG TPA: ABC transporter permease [Vicinamibacterales bacterium]|nr:ABC transporter permease [Acidobacteriota bacterium]HQX80970.1 ABC transporter permease [Vicinamibacterales bacterium]